MLWGPSEILLGKRGAPCLIGVMQRRLRDQRLPGIPLGMSSAATFDGAPPEVADVVVIGGGVIGVSTAIFLARAGQRVVLLEKGRIAGEQSGRNWGWIRQQGRDPAELPIMMEANTHWQAFARETNVDFGLHQHGVTYLAEREDQLAGYERWLASVAGSGVDSRLLSAAKVDQLIPGMSRRYLGGIHTPSDLRAEPWLAVPALAGIAARDGVTVVENCAVRRLDLAAGRIAGVVTEAGRIATQSVVLAGGAWSSLFLQAHGVHIPQLSVRATVAATEALPARYQGGAADSRIAFRHRADGGYSLAAGGFHELFVGPDAFRAFSKFWTQLKADPFGTRLCPLRQRATPTAGGRRGAGLRMRSARLKRCAC